MTTYPVRLLNGKNAPWYFLARLARNDPYNDADMGDRMLAIWQGQGFYHFTTCNTVGNQNNVIQNVNYADIEGVWTYIYYSYSIALKRAVAFVKYGLDSQPTRIQFDVTHPLPIRFKFVVGG